MYDGMGYVAGFSIFFIFLFFPPLASGLIYLLVNYVHVCGRRCCIVVWCGMEAWREGRRDSFITSLLRLAMRAKGEDARISAQSIVHTKRLPKGGGCS